MKGSLLLTLVLYAIFAVVLLAGCAQAPAPGANPRSSSRARVSAKQDLGNGLSWKATGRLDYDAAYDALATLDPPPSEPPAATASQLLPVPAGPTPKVIVLLRMASM